MARLQKYTDEQIIEALKATKGMVYLAAERVGCEADTIYNRAKKSKAVAEVIRAERGKVVDTSELRLFTAILNGEAWAVLFSLRTLGKDRGYVERQEVQTDAKTFGEGVRKKLDAIDASGPGQPGEVGGAQPANLEHPGAPATRQPPPAADGDGAA